MARWDYFQGDFSLGELSPLMAGRRDSPDYNRGLATCLNAIIGQRGEWVRRPGTRFVHSTKDNSPARLVEMITAEQRPILLEFGDKSVRLSLFDGADIEYRELSTPYTETEIWQLDWAQSGNSLFIVHPDVPPQHLYRNQLGIWTIEAIVFSDGPYLRQNTADDRLFGGDEEGVWTPVGHTTFTVDDVGRMVRLRDQSGHWHWGITSGFRNSRRLDVAWHSHATIEAGQNDLLAPTMEWQTGAFWPGNYPSAICFHNNRLVLAATRSNPQSFWASQTGDYTNFGPSAADGEVLANNAIFAALNDRQINRIQWLISSQESLVAGTASGLWIVSGGDGKGAITPSTVQAQRLSGATSADIRPTSIDRSTLFVERSGRRLLALKRDTVELIYLTPDVSIRSEHMLASGIQAMAYQAVPWSTNWCLMADGTLAGLTMGERDHALGWHRHEIAGPQTRVLSIAAIPGHRRDNGRKQDQLYLVVERTLPTGKRYSVEVLGDAFENGTQIEDAEFVDAAIKAELHRPFTGVPGLAHLEGLLAEGLSDGNVVTPARVSDGVVQVEAGKKIIVGLPYESRADFMDIDAVSMGSFSDGKPRHLYEVILRLWRTVCLEASVDGHWVEYGGDDPRRLNQSVESWLAGPNEPYSGGLRLKRGAGGWSRQLKMSWRQRAPLPLVVLSALLRFQDSDG